MNTTGDNGLSEISQGIDTLRTDNEILQFLGNAIKYVCDTLLDSQEQITAQEQMKIDLLLEKLKGMKAIFQKYSQFFEQNKSEIKQLLQFKNTIEILEEKIYFPCEILKLTDYFSKLQKDLLEVLAYTDTFFTINNFSDDEKNSFQSLLDIIGKGKTKQEKILTVRNELTHIEGFIGRIEKRFQKLEHLVEDVNTDIKKTSQAIQELFSEQVATLFGKIPSGNIAFLFQENFFLTLALEGVFHRIPKNIHSLKSFLENLISISTSKNYKMLKQKSIFHEEDYENVLKIFSVYERLYELHFSIQGEISQVKSELHQVTTGQVFLLPQNREDSEVKKLKVFSTGKPAFLQNLKDLKLNGAHIFDEMKLEKSFVGNPQLLKIKKDIFSQLFSLLELLASTQIEVSFLENLTFEQIEKIAKAKKIKDFSVPEKIVKSMLEIMKLHARFLQEKKEHSLSGSSFEGEGKKSSFHYKPVLDEYGVIQKFEEVKTDELIAKTIGKTANQIREMIASILSRDEFSHILGTFPGNTGSLEGNYIILGPWGGGKTALIKELSQNPDIATVEIGKADMVSMWVGSTEKNIKAIYEQSYKLHCQTKKHVFIFIDEVDSILSPISTTRGGIDIQKEFQTMLDGVHAYPGVHTIMLSNVPHRIPIDIYRRMEKTFVLSDLDLKEKVELISSRIERYPLAADLQEFLKALMEYYPNLDFLLNSGFELEYLEEYVESDNLEMLKKIQTKDKSTLLELYLQKTLKITDANVRENIKRIYLITPKILWQVTENLFKKYIEKFGRQERVKLNKQLSQLKDKTDGKKVHKIFAQFEHTMILADFFHAMNQVFSSASVRSEIAGNIRFYEQVEDMLQKISSNAFDSLKGESVPYGKSIFQLQIIEP